MIEGSTRRIAFDMLQKQEGDIVTLFGIMPGRANAWDI